MKRFFPILLVLLLLWAQAYLSLQGGPVFGIFIGPFILLPVFLLILIPFPFGNADVSTLSVSSRNHYKLLLWVIAGVAYSIVCLFYANGFREYSDFAKSSDVIPQLETLYDRLARGEQPYYPLETIDYHPYPVYMPAHWLPIGISKLLHIDVRWSGVMVMGLCYGVYVQQAIKSKVDLFHKVIVVLLVPTVLMAFYEWARMEICVTIETTVAAYYLLLATGLWKRSIALTMLGIILCLLSRYTMVFWLPVFAVLLLVEKPFSASVKLWLSVVGALVVFYILPFLLRQPDILVDGLTYHNKAAIAEWAGYGDPPVSWTFTSGNYFAPHFKALFSGSLEDRVFKTRVVQAVTMILLCIACCAIYLRKRRKVNLYDFGLATVFCFVVVFYMVGVLTYKYYFLSPMMLSAVLAGKKLAPYSKEQTLKN